MALISLFLFPILLSWAPVCEATPASKLTAAVNAVGSLFRGRSFGDLAAVPHRYSDKFDLAELLVNMAVSDALEPLADLGLTVQKIDALFNAPSPFKIVARVAAENVTFVRKELLDSRKTILKTVFDIETTFTQSGTVTYVYDIDYVFSISAVDMLDVNAVPDMLVDSVGRVTTHSESQQSPRVFATADISVAALKRFVTAVVPIAAAPTTPLCLGDSGAASACISTSAFWDGTPGIGARIDREVNDSVVTPTRNPLVEQFLKDAAAVAGFASKVQNAADSMVFYNRLHMPSFSVDSRLVLDARPCGMDPVDALFDDDQGPVGSSERSSSADKNCTPAVVLSGEDADVLRRRFTTAYAGVQRSWAMMLRNVVGSGDGKVIWMRSVGTSGGRMFTEQGGRASLAARVLAGVADQVKDDMEGIEDVLMQEVRAAVGEYVTTDDLYDYTVGFSSEKLIAHARPSPLAVTVRPGGGREAALITSSGAGGGDDSLMAADGAVTLQYKRKNGDMRALHTITHPVHRGRGWRVPLPTGSMVHLNVSSKLHGFLWPNVENTYGRTPEFELTVDARPFGAVILVLGTLSSSRIPTLQPEAAVLVRDGQSITIPLVHDMIPTAKEFQRAINSLSVEMQTFAKAFRQMQLSRSVFAMAAIPVRPQLERLLRLPLGSLSKEVALSDAVLSLAVKMSISPALLAYDPSVDGSVMASRGSGADAAIRAVWDGVNEVHDMVALIEASATAERERVERLQRIWDEAKMRADKREELSKVYAPQTHSLAPGGRTYDSMAGGMGMSSRARAPMSAPMASPPMARGDEEDADSAGGDDDDDDDGAEKADTDKGDDATGNAKDEGGDASDPTKKVVQVKKLDPTALRTLAQRMDAKFLENDAADLLRPTLLEIGERWEERKTPDSYSSTIWSSQQKSRKDDAFALLDLLSLGGSAPFQSADVHFVMGATFNLADSILQTVVRKDKNVFADLAAAQRLLAEVITGLSEADLVLNA